MIDSWIATYTKKQLYPFDPKPDQFCVEDIAHSLSLQCRFQGHIPQHYCVPPDTLILKDTFDWVPAGDLNIGDNLIAFDEFPQKTPNRILNRRKLQPSVVRHNGIITRPVYRIICEDGPDIFSSEEHPWLCALKISRNQSWQTTLELFDAVNRGLKRYLLKFFNTWQRQSTFDAGWLSAVFDCEGHACGQTKSRGFCIGVAQNPNCVLDRIKYLLETFNIPYACSLNNKSSEVIKISVLGEYRNRFEFLGKYGGCRLLNKATGFLHDDKLSLDLQAQDLVKIEHIEYVGEREVVALETSTRTYFANGFGAHNSVCEHSCRVAFETWKAIAVDDDYSEQERKELILQGLFHDSSESAICDVPRPIKPYLTGYKEAEEKIMAVIAQKFKFPWPMHPIIKECDNRMLVTEARDLLNTDSQKDWPSFKDVEPYHQKIVPMPSVTAERLFKKIALDPLRIFRYTWVYE